MTKSPAHGHNDELIRGLGAALTRIGLPPPDTLERLSGGANMESWRFNAGTTQCVLRRAPSAKMMADRLLDHHGEAALIQAAKAAGVTAPEVLVELDLGDGIGSGFVMRCLPGTPDPAMILESQDPAALLADLARELAAIHRVPVAASPAPVMDTVAALAELEARFLSYGGDRPILARH